MINTPPESESTPSSPSWAHNGMSNNPSLNSNNSSMPSSSPSPQDVIGRGGPGSRSSEETGDLFSDSTTGPLTIPTGHSSESTQVPRGIRRRMAKATPTARRFIRFLAGTIVFYFIVSIAAIILMVVCPKSGECDDNCTTNVGQLCGSQPCLCSNSIATQVWCSDYKSERCEDDFFYTAIVLFILSGIVLVFLIVVAVYACYSSKVEPINSDYLVVN
eukprot:TRINITY_DN5064_c0_g1_i1.p1 TRINITY_DN5064_c0_g1~~TRINITY_DN5064_c0_g1_i1.p1  ORF type:complete len:217 (-),score=38.12 TRINITY_DN5064_c0_g1_i1:361-1011(-)